MGGERPSQGRVPGRRLLLEPVRCGGARGNPLPPSPGETKGWRLSRAELPLPRPLRAGSPRRGCFTPACPWPGAGGFDAPGLCSGGLGARDIRWGVGGEETPSPGFARGRRWPRPRPRACGAGLRRVSLGRAGIGRAKIQSEKMAPLQCSKDRLS